MAAFGKESLAMLKEVEKPLVDVCNLAIKVMDFKVIDGLRTLDEQAANVVRGKSWTMNSKHLPDRTTGKSKAVDLAPYPVIWTDIESFCVLAGIMKAAAHTLGIKLRWGGDWDSDMNLQEERKRDYGHFEIVD